MPWKQNEIRDNSRTVLYHGPRLTVVEHSRRNIKHITSIVQYGTLLTPEDIRNLAKSQKLRGIIE